MPAPTDPSPTALARSTRLLACLVLLVAAGFGLTRSLAAAGRPPSAMLAPARIDLNTAGAAELDLLPRIGPALAARIIEDRAAHGPYQSLEDLRRVRGIGPKTVEGLRPVAGVSRTSAANADE